MSPHRAQVFLSARWNHGQHEGRPWKVEGSDQVALDGGDEGHVGVEARRDFDRNADVDGVLVQEPIDGPGEREVAVAQGAVVGVAEIFAGHVAS